MRRRDGACARAVGGGAACCVLLPAAALLKSGCGAKCQGERGWRLRQKVSRTWARMVAMKKGILIEFGSSLRRRTGVRHATERAKVRSGYSWVRSPSTMASYTVDSSAQSLDAEAGMRQYS